MFKQLNKQQKGFTLIEVLVVVGILAILLSITLIALNPAKHFQDARNTQRSSDVTAILNAVYQYQAANKGSLPTSLSAIADTTAHPLKKSSPTVSTEIDLCSVLSPSYIADLPMDPSTGTKTPSTGALCAATTYDTGYTITKSTTGNRFTVSAPGTEGGGTVISVTR